MAGPRPIWKGALQVSLVSIPVRMVASAEKSEKYSFNQLHDKCKGRVRSKGWCPTCAVEVTNEEKLRGYEHKKGEYVIIGDDELDACEIETSHTLKLDTVVRDKVNPLHIESTSYLIPDGPAAVHAFETLRVGLGDRMAIGGVVIRKKSWQVALTAAKDGFVVYMLRGKDQVRELSSLDRAVAIKPPKEDVALATRLLDMLEGTFDYEGVRDDYTAQVRALIEAKVTGGPTPTAAPKPAANVSSLADALKASLDAASQKKRPAAKMEAEPPKSRRKAG